MSEMPKAKWRAGQYETALWENISKDGKFTVRSISLQKSWKNKEGGWERSAIKSILPNDLIKIQLVINKAVEELFMKENEEEVIDGSEAEEIKETPKQQSKEDKKKILAEQFAKGNLTAEGFEKALKELK